ncbi:hypothetical protein [Bradyrhizobium sp. SYSU BS000235]|uniref:hypothetical protein n=1 Tax=Bradyrhizobium sp. SYSU BS000235 TaxID=3411332 RepID=UPI003C709501
MSKLCYLASTLLVATVIAAPASAYDLNGVWASDADRCDKIFKKSGKRVSFAQMADLYGSGFIVDSSSLRGKAARCIVKSRRETQDALHILASCSSDIMLSNVQFSVRFKDDNSLTRFFPDIPGMELTYYRCTAM